MIIDQQKGEKGDTYEGGSKRCASGTDRVITSIETIVVRRRNKDKGEQKVVHRIALQARNWSCI